MSRRAKDPPEGSQWSGVVSKVKGNFKHKKEADQFLASINRLRERAIVKKEEFNPKYADRMKKIYGDAITAIKKQRQSLAQAQESLAFFLSLAETPVTSTSASETPTPQEPYEKKKKFDITQPLPIIKTKPFPPLCGPVPAAANYIVPTDSLVAAQVNPGSEWILAVVTKKTGNKYDVIDCDEVDVPKPQVHSVTAKQMVPLPTTLPDVKFKAEFPERTPVLALYPQTTCFYRATVVEAPSKNKTGDYLVLFEEEEEQEGVVPHIPVNPRLVLAAPKDPQKK